MKVMKVAILHDYLNQLGGAERVLMVFLDLFPEADLFTLFYDEEKTRGVFKGRVTGTSPLDAKFIRRRHRFFIPSLPLVSRLTRSRKEYDIALSSTAGYAKGFRVKAACHISYCHTPLRYAWEEEYRSHLPLPGIALTAARPIAAYLRRWDRRTAEEVDVFLANSEYIAEKIRRCYGRSAEVIHPPVGNCFFEDVKTESGGEYCCMVGRLLPYKRFDLGIEACKALGVPLVIVGAGPERKRMEEKIKGNALVRYRPYASDEELRDLYTHARALIFPQVEDFGLVAAEAQACGTPVVAYGKGGGKEIVEDGKTGILFYEQNKESLMAALVRLETAVFERKRIRKKAERFSEERFKDRIKEIIRSYAGSSL